MYVRQAVNYLERYNKLRKSVRTLDSDGQKKYFFQDLRNEVLVFF